MHRLSSGVNNVFTAGERGAFYWMRVTYFLPGATFSFGGQNPIVADSLIGYECQSGQSWKQIDLTGTITVEVGDDPAEKFPGPPNPQGLIQPLYQGNARGNLGASGTRLVFTIDGRQWASLKIAIAAGSGIAQLALFTSPDFNFTSYNSPYGRNMANDNIFSLDGSVAIGGALNIEVPLPGDCVQVVLQSNGGLVGAPLDVTLSGLQLYNSACPVSAILYDKTSGVAAALDTGNFTFAISGKGWRELGHYFKSNGGVPAYAISEIDETTGLAITAPLITSAADFQGALGPGCTPGGTAGLIAPTAGIIVPRLPRYTSAAIAAQISRIRVTARR